MANNIIIQYSEQEFKILLQECIKESLEAGYTGEKTDPDAILNVKQAAAFLDIAVQTLYGYTSNFSIPFFKKGKKLYFKKTELLKWISEGRKH